MQLEHNENIRTVDQAQLWGCDQPFLGEPDLHKKENDSRLLSYVVKLLLDVGEMFFVFVFVWSYCLVDAFVVNFVVEALEVFAHMFPNVPVCRGSLYKHRYENIQKLCLKQFTNQLMSKTKPETFCKQCLDEVWGNLFGKKLRSDEKYHICYRGNIDEGWRQAHILLTFADILTNNERHFLPLEVLE